MYTYITNIYIQIYVENRPLNVAKINIYTKYHLNKTKAGFLIIRK